MTLKKIITSILLISISIYLSFSVYHFITNKLDPTYLDCGTVISKSNDYTIIKNGKIHKDEVGEVFAIKGKTIYVCYPDTGCFKVGETNLTLLGTVAITSSDQFRTC